MTTKKKILPVDGVRVGRSSAGLGLFATKAFKKGDRIIEYFGRVISPEEEYTSRSKYLFEVSTRKTIDGTTRENIARYINHSCKPNCEPEIVRGRIFIDAIKAIKPGDEFTYDYGEEYFDEHIRPKGCRCHVHTVLKK
jgi:SET domain-containing protein